MDLIDSESELSEALPIRKVKRKRKSASKHRRSELDALRAIPKNEVILSSKRGIESSKKKLRSKIF